MEAVQRYIRRTHIKTAAQRDWSTATQAMQVALDTMRRMQVRSETTMGYTMALSRAELDAVYANRIVDWAGADADDPPHPLRLAAKAIATFICTDMTADGDVKLSLTAHSMSTHHTKIREHRAEVAASVAMPILGMKPNDRRGGDYTRARAVVDRASRHPMFVAVKQPPRRRDATRGGRHLNLRSMNSRRWPTRSSTRAWTPQPTRRASAGTARPRGRCSFWPSSAWRRTRPLRTPLAGEAASPWQLTINGLGGTRGDTLTTPDLVMSNVLARRKKDGVHQLAEVVKASLAGAIPPNTLDPTAADVDDKGIASRAHPRHAHRDASCAPMRSGWTRGGERSRSKGDTASAAAGDPYDRALAALSDAVASRRGQRVARSVTPTARSGSASATAGCPTPTPAPHDADQGRSRTLLQEGRFIAKAHAACVGGRLRRRGRRPVSAAVPMAELASYFGERDVEYWRYRMGTLCDPLAPAAVYGLEHDERWLPPGRPPPRAPGMHLRGRRRRRRLPLHRAVPASRRQRRRARRRAPCHPDASPPVCGCSRCEPTARRTRSTASSAR